MKRSTKPKFLIHGEADELIPLRWVREFYAQLEEPKEVIEIERANHLFEGQASEVGDALEDSWKISHAGRSNRLGDADFGEEGAGRIAAHGAADDMAAAVIAKRCDVRPASIPRDQRRDIGCAMPEAKQGLNVARIASLRAGVPVSASAVTVNRFCASGLEAIATAAERIICGHRRRDRRRRHRVDEHGADGRQQGVAQPNAGGQLSGRVPHHGLVTENHAREAGISREEQDAFALRSHERALTAIEAGRFVDEITSAVLSGRGRRLNS